MELLPKHCTNVIKKRYQSLKLRHAGIKRCPQKISCSGEPDSALANASQKNRKVRSIRLLSDKSLGNEWLGLLITVGLTNAVKFIGEITKVGRESLYALNEISLPDFDSNELDRIVPEDASQDSLQKMPQNLETAENVSSNQSSSTKEELNTLEDSTDASIQKAVINKSHISMLSAPLSSEEVLRRIERNKTLKTEMASRVTNYGDGGALDSNIQFDNGSSGNGGGGDDGGEGGEGGESNDDSDGRKRSYIIRLLALLVCVSFAGIFAAIKKNG